MFEIQGGEVREVGRLVPSFCSHGRWVVRAGGVWLRLVALTLGFLLGLAMSASAAPDPLEPLGLQAPKEQVEAPDFTLPDVSGKKLRLKDFRGKVVFLNFFATWCEPCRLEMPAMERLSQTYRDKGLMVLAVDMHESAESVRAFMQELKLSFPAVVDADGSVGFMYGVRPIPATFLIARDGQILWRAFGARDWDSAEAHAYFGKMLTRRGR